MREEAAPKERRTGSRGKAARRSTAFLLGALLAGTLVTRARGEDVATPVRGDTLEVVVAEYVEDVQKSLPSLEVALRDEDAKFRQFEQYKRQIRADAAAQRAVLALSRLSPSLVSRARDNWNSWAEICRARMQAATRTLDYAKFERNDEAERWGWLGEDEWKNASPDAMAVYARAQGLHQRKTDLLTRLEARAQAGVDSAKQGVTISEETLETITAAENRARARFLSTRTDLSDFAAGLVDVRAALGDLAAALTPKALVDWALGLGPAVGANAVPLITVLLAAALLLWRWRQLQGLLLRGAASLAHTPSPPRLIAVAALLALGRALPLAALALLAFAVREVLGSGALDWTDPLLDLAVAVLALQFMRRLIREVVAPDDADRRWLTQDLSLAERVTRDLRRAVLWLFVVRLIQIVPWGTSLVPPPLVLSILVIDLLVLRSLRRVLAPEVLRALHGGASTLRVAQVGRFAVDLVTVLFVGMAGVGYLNLAAYTTWGVVRTLVVMAGTAVAWRAGADLVQAMTTSLPQRARQASRTAWTVSMVVATAAAIPFAWSANAAAVNAVQDVFALGIDIGGQRITVLRILVAGAWFGAALFAGRLVSALVERGMFTSTGIDVGLRTAIGRSAFYALVSTGVLLAIFSLGFDLTNLAIVAGALGVGVGLGLQMLVSNFVSGLVILYERPFRIGDILEHEGMLGTVWQIQVRSTVLRTFDEAEVVLPNSDLISHKIVNWTLSSNRARAAIKLGVSYDSDVAMVRDTLLRVAGAHKRVLEPPRVYFTGFGDNALEFTLLVWVDIRERLDVVSDLHFAIDAAFREAGIRIPFPQRDVRVVTDAT